MRWQTTAVLAVLLLALGGFYYLYEVRWAPAREEAASRKGRLFVADTKDVTEVVIKRAEDTVRRSARARTGTCSSRSARARAVRRWTRRSPIS
jgi:hypothetical protein